MRPQTLIFVTYSTNSFIWLKKFSKKNQNCRSYFNFIKDRVEFWNFLCPGKISKILGLGFGAFCDISVSAAFFGILPRAILVPFCLPEPIKKIPVLEDWHWFLQIKLLLSLFTENFEKFTQIKQFFSFYFVVFKLSDLDIL